MGRKTTVVLDVCWDSPSVHIVWALKPGDANLLAVCTTEEKAAHYVDNYAASKLFAEHKFHVEQVVLDHGFGFKDSLMALALRRGRS